MSEDVKDLFNAIGMQNFPYRDYSDRGDGAKWRPLTVMVASIVGAKVGASNPASQGAWPQGAAVGPGGFAPSSGPPLNDTGSLAAYLRSLGDLRS